MKTLLTFLFICFISLYIYSQESSIVNIGINLPVFFPGQLGYSDVQINSKPCFFLERPLKLNFSQIKYLSINPGFEYFTLTENCYHARSSNDFNRNVHHKSISTYLKVIKKYNIGRGHLKLYFGTFSGIHLYSTSKGEEHWTVYYLDGKSYGGSEIIDKKGSSDFFHLIYYGTLIGIESNLKRISWLSPGLELNMLPNFGTVKKDDYETNFGGFEITLKLDFEAQKQK